MLFAFCCSFADLFFYNFCWNFIPLNFLNFLNLSLPYFLCCTHFLGKSQADVSDKNCFYEKKLARVVHREIHPEE